MQKDFQQATELELGRERVAQPAHGRLQPDPLLLDQLEALVSLLDPLVAIARQQPEQEHQRQHEQDRAGVLAGGDRGQEAQRGQRGVNRPDQPDHPDLHIELGHDAGQPGPDQ